MPTSLQRASRRSCLNSAWLKDGALFLIINGTVANDVCDSARQLTMLKQNAPGFSASSDYTYDAVGNSTSQQRSDGTTETYGYDATDQLTGTNFDNQAIGLKDHNVTYTYDPSGNRLDATDNGDATAYASNPLNQYTAVAGDPLSYDANGNLASQKGWTYTYDAQNRITNAQRGSIQMSFAYDPLNRCIKRTLNGTPTYFCHAGWNLIEEHSGNSTLLASYVHGANTDEILSKTDIAGTVYYHQDALGNVTYLTDASGNVVEQYRYDAFGKPTFLDAQNNVLANSAYGNRFLFTGREWLQDIALYDYRNRFYLPELGRFLQTDPVRFDAADMNLYRYVENNPVNAVDPDGHGKVYRLWNCFATSAVTGPKAKCCPSSVTGDGQGFQKDRAENSAIQSMISKVPSGCSLSGTPTIRCSPINAYFYGDSDWA